MFAAVYFSTASENTHRFVGRLDVTAQRILTGGDLRAVEPYVLITPTYGSPRTGGFVPRPVISFLNVAENRALLRGVVAGGSRTFGAEYALAGDIIAAKCGVPLLHRFELLGTNDDADLVRERMIQPWPPLPT